MERNTDTTVTQGSILSNQDDLTVVQPPPVETRSSGPVLQLITEAGF